MKFADLPQEFHELLGSVIDKTRADLEAGLPLSTSITVGVAGTSEQLTIPMKELDTASKEATTGHARRVAATMGADYSLTTGLAWSIPAKDMPKLSEIMAKYGMVSNYPKRIEVVFFNLETPHGLWGGQALLKAKPPSKRRRTFGDVNLIHVTSSQGMLTNILPATLAAEAAAATKH